MTVRPETGWGFRGWVFGVTRGLQAWSLWGDRLVAQGREDLRLQPGGRWLPGLCCPAGQGRAALAHREQ